VTTATAQYAVSIFLRISTFNQSGLMICCAWLLYLPPLHTLPTEARRFSSGYIDIAGDNNSQTKYKGKAKQQQGCQGL
jgi:hypothetical protein